MNRRLLFLPLGLVLGVLAYGVVYWLQVREHRAIVRAPHAELAWLRTEFGLSGPQWERVAALHDAYRPTCNELCRQIAVQNARLEAAALATNRLTDDVRALIAETGRVRDQCRQAMLGHLYTVAAELPPEAGQRYLRLMLAATCIVEAAHPIDSAHPVTGAQGGGHAH